MPKSVPQKLAQAKYDQKSYDQILIKVKKGKREEYKAAADERGLGQMEMIRLAVEEFISKENLGTENLSAADRRLVESAAKLPESTRKIIGKLIDDLAAQVTKGGGEND